MPQQLSPEMKKQIEVEAEKSYQETDYYKPTGQTMWHRAYIAGATKYAILLEDAERRLKEAMSLLSPAPRLRPV